MNLVFLISKESFSFFFSMCLQFTITEFYNPVLKWIVVLNFCWLVIQNFDSCLRHVHFIAYVWIYLWINFRSATPILYFDVRKILCVLSINWIIHWFSARIQPSEHLRNTHLWLVEYALVPKADVAAFINDMLLKILQRWWFKYRQTGCT